MRAAAAYIAAAPCLHGACVLPLRPTLKKRAVQRKMAGERGLSQSGPSHSYRPLGLVHNLNLGALDGVGARPLGVPSSRMVGIASEMNSWPGTVAGVGPVIGGEMAPSADTVSCARVEARPSGRRWFQRTPPAAPLLPGSTEHPT